MSNAKGLPTKWSGAKDDYCFVLILKSTPKERLIALGGKTPSCLQVLNLWESAVSDGGFIEEWAGCFKADKSRRWWLSAALERLKSEGVQDFLHDLPRTRATKMCEVTVGLPHEFLDLAAVTVVAQADEGLRDLDHHSLLDTRRSQSKCAVVALLF